MITYRRVFNTEIVLSYEWPFISFCRPSCGRQLLLPFDGLTFQVETDRGCDFAWIHSNPGELVRKNE